VSDRSDIRPSGDDTPENPEVAEVRRLLADARHTEPMPADVAARMADVIARLGDETPASLPVPATPKMVAIAPHRRRRAAALLTAAAAIVVAGVVVQNVHLTPSGSDNSMPRSEAGGDTASGQSLDAGPQDDKAPETPRATSGDTALSTPVKVRPQSFVADAERVRQALGTTTFSARNAAKAVCPDVPRHGRAVPATYKHAEAALVFRRPQGGSQVVELFLCGQTTPIRTATLSVP
jgi:hypothetical protein